VYTTVGLEYGGERLDILGVLGGSILVVHSILERFSHLFPSQVELIDLSWVRQRVG
jgi:hypothetical protein